MEKLTVRISVRNLVEFILREGDIDSRRGATDKEAMQKGSRLHRKIQGRQDATYRAEVSLKWKSEYEDVIILVEGRADGIFMEEGETFIDEIKGVLTNLENIKEPVSIWHRQSVMQEFTERWRTVRVLESR